MFKNFYSHIKHNRKNQKKKEKKMKKTNKISIYQENKNKTQMWLKEYMATTASPTRALCIKNSQGQKKSLC